MTKVTKKSWILYSILCVCLVVLFMQGHKEYVKGKVIVKEFLSQKLESQLDQVKNKVRLEWDNLDISLIPLRVKMENVVVDIRKNKNLPKPIQIKTLIVSPDYLAILNRTLSARLTLIEPEIELHRKKSHQQTRQGKFNLNTYLSLDFFKGLYLSNIVLKSATIHFKEKENTLATFKKMYANIRLNLEKITINIEDPFVSIDGRPTFSISTKVNIKPDMIYVDFLKVKNDLSWLNAQGMVVGTLEKGHPINSSNLQVEGGFLSEDLASIIKVVDPSFQLPFSGKIKLKSDLRYSKSSQLEGYIELSTQDFYVQDTFLSKVDMKARIQKRNMVFEKFHIKNSTQWDINLKESNLKLKDSYPFQAKVSIRKSELDSLLKLLDVEETYLTSKVNGDWKCSGSIFRKQNIKCNGRTYFNQFQLESYSNINILSLSKLTVKSTLNFKDRALKILSSIKLNEKSMVNMENNWNPKDRFSSSFKGTVHASDIENLIDIEPEGILNIQNGTLTVKKNKIDIQSSIDLEDFVLKGFRMGQIKTELSYTEKGILKFKKIRGQIRESNYKGQVSIDLFKDRLQVFAHFPRVTLDNLTYALEDRIQFPFKITGKGPLTVRLNGPLQINIMNYTVDAQISKIKWKDETFDRAIIQLISEKGYVKTKKVEFFKNRGRVFFQGKVNPKGQMVAKMTGRNMLIQESENISQVIGSETTGVMDFDMDLIGFWLEPRTTANILIKKSFHRGYPINNSNIILNIRGDQVEAKGSLSDKVMVQKLIFPYKETSRVVLKAQTKNLDIKDFVRLSQESSALYNQSESSIDSDIDLSFQKNQFSKSVTGKVKVNNFFAKANSYKLVNQSPFLLTLKKGRFKTEPIFLKTNKQSLKLVQTQKNLIKITGNTKLDFLIFLFPFMQTWEGDLAVNVNVLPRLFQFSPKGNMKLQNGFIQFNQYVEPFEDTYADVQVQDNNLKFLSFDTKMGGGTLQAKGDVSFATKNLMPVSAVGSFKDVQLSSFPDMYTVGSGQLSLNGNNFPYTLGMTADISNTRIETEFISKSANEIQMNPRISILEGDKVNFEPIRMNFNLTLKDPLQVENSTMKSSFNGKIRIAGYPSNPLLSGKLVALPGGTIVFRDHQFEVLSNRVNYQNNQPNNPIIDLRARTTIQEEEETSDFADEYNIQLRIQGRGSKAVFKLTSTPTLNDNEIASLLAFGVRSIRFDPGNTINNLAKYSYYQLGPVLFQKAIGQELKDTLGVDQFLIVPHISTKDNSPSTKVIVRKKLFNKLNLSAGQTILDNHPESDVKAQYKINKNVSVIGVWQNEDPIDGRDTDPNTVGLDLEYQLDF